ncbi:MAG: BLUF domain-containing protein [Flavobacteriaceae bacterium]|nr:BLUF domain-containing protein [Flavobacteriaceae bacterium]
MIHVICYISNSIVDISNQDIHEIFEITLQNNKKRNITGILIYNNGHFFQVLEGKESDVEYVYSRIIEDYRHHGIIKLLETKIKDSIFAEYETGFTVMKDFSRIRKLKIYFDWIKEANYKKANELVNLANNFIKNSQ